MYFLSLSTARVGETAQPTQKLRELARLLERLERSGAAAPGATQKYELPQGVVIAGYEDLRVGPYSTGRYEAKLEAAMVGSLEFATPSFQSELRHVNEALARLRERLLQRLARDLDPQTADALMTYLDARVTVDLGVSEAVAAARGEVTRMELPPVRQPSIHVDLSDQSVLNTPAARDTADVALAYGAGDLAKVLGVSDETVRNREQAGELFSLLRPGRKRGREYPVFQLWPAVAGAPLKAILTALGRPSGPAAYAFFTSAQDTLAGLSPLEALVGTASREVSPEAHEFLRAGRDERLATVVRAAQTYASSLAA